MTPPYDSLLVCAEQAPLSTATYLQLWRHCYDENCDCIQFDKDESEEWEGLLQDLEILEIWGLLRLEFISPSQVEVTLPMRNGQKLPHLDL